MNTPSLPLGPLLTAARAGDRDAMDQLLVHYYPTVRGMVHRSLAADLRRKKPWLSAMFSTGDIVQEVFQSVVRDLDHFESDNEGAFVNYLVSLVQNRLLDAVRFHEALRRNPRRAPHGLDRIGQEATDTRGPAEVVEAEEQLRRYAVAIARLSPRERTLLRRRLHTTETFAQLAEHLGYPSEDSARKAFYAAQARLLVEFRTQRP
ncbi:MAG: sigma-70 family RNA polymerase sigma factor [Planctomycetota bacterium]